MARTAAFALAFMALMAGPAQATDFQVIVVPGLTLDDLEDVADRGAVGLLNPGAGPETSRALAMRALVTGEVRNSLRGEDSLGGGLRADLPGGGSAARQRRRAT